MHLPQLLVNKLYFCFVSRVVIEQSAAGAEITCVSSFDMMPLDQRLHKLFLNPCEEDMTTEEIRAILRVDEVNSSPDLEALLEVKSHNVV